MNSRSIVTLVVAVVIGLGAMKLSQQLLSSGNKAEEMQDVLVAARDIKEEESLKPDMVRVVRMAKSAVPPKSFTSFKEVEERWVRTAMLEGDALIEKKLGPKGSPPGLVANIPKGMRAFAIDVNEQSGVSGFILPGHRVGVVRFDSNEKGNMHGETILQDVLVLASGQLFTRPDERAVQSRTVTLALTPADVDILVAARAKGALSLSLRGLHDHNLVDQTKPKPAIDPEHERRWKLEEQKRQRVELELQRLKAELAKKVVEPPPPKRRAIARIATIYRGLHNLQRVRTDLPAVSELEVADEASAPEALGDRASSVAQQSPVVADGNERKP
jgi:pilus assembly protein CpaB